MDFSLEYAEETYYRFFPDNRGGMRARNAGRNNRRNQQGINQHGIARVRLTRIILEFILRGYMVYLFIANLCLSTTQVDVTKLEIESMYINHDILDFTTVRFGGNATLQTILQLDSDFTPTPELGVFNLSIISKPNPVSTFANGNFKISGNEKQVLVLKFKPHESQLPHKELINLLKTMERGEAWLRLDISFQWQLNKKWFLVFPIHHRRTDLSCNFLYADLPVGDKHPIICK
ncbi:hypothetical protein Tco_1325977 [Tanacetum coccineum]